MDEPQPKPVLQEFAELYAREKELEAELNDVKAKRQALDDRVKERLSELGLKNAPLESGVTVFTERTLWANAAEVDGERERAAACAALKAAGLGEFVQETFNVQSLSAYFRERERELEAELREAQGLGEDEPVVVDPEDLIPEPLRGYIDVAEVVKAKARKS